MTSPAMPLLARADSYARDILMDSYTTDAGQIVHGWAVTMRSASTAWDAIPTDPDQQTNDIATGTPFTTAAMIATHLETDDAIVRGSGSPNSPMAKIARLLDEAAPIIGDQLPGDPDPGMTRQADAGLLRATLLHVGYVLTHAAANSAIRQAVLLADVNPELSHRFGLIASRVRGIEHTLDAHLHRPPHQTPITTDIQTLDKALDRLMRSAYQIGPSGNAASYLLLADIGRAVTGTTARLAIESVQAGRAPAAEVRDRLLPALQTGVQQWEASRQAWSRLLAPTDRPGPQLAAAGIQLQRGLHQPGLAAHPAITTTITRALTLANELAVLNHQALASPDRRAPAASVARLTAKALENAPAGVDPVRTWLSLERITGSALMPMPGVVREYLDRQGRATLDAALGARSAGHTLADRTGYHALVALQQDTTRPRHPPHEPPRAAHPGAAAPRIG